MTFFSNETTIKNRFNRLCSQFENNAKYISLSETAQTIPTEEDISYEMLVNKKQYEAYFYQVPESSDIRQPDSVEEGENIQKYMSMFEEQKEKGNTDILQLLSQFILNTSKNCVWFKIGGDIASRKYVIAIYYENDYNMANGEDL